MMYLVTAYFQAYFDSWKTSKVNLFLMNNNCLDPDIELEYFINN